MSGKVDTRLLAHWIANPEVGDAINALHNEKMKWCMHKDKIVLNTSKNHVDPAIKAYPMVITTVGDMKPEARERVCCLLVLNSVISTPQWIRQPEAAWVAHPCCVQL
jgi:hypothetical protein